MTTSSASRFRDITDQDLLRELTRLAGKGRALEAELLAHLAEVDLRKLYLQEACSSMFGYCTDVLRFSEYAASNRIAVARAARSTRASVRSSKSSRISTPNHQ